MTIKLSFEPTILYISDEPAAAAAAELVEEFFFLDYNNGFDQIIQALEDDESLSNKSWSDDDSSSSGSLSVDLEDCDDFEWHGIDFPSRRMAPRSGGGRRPSLQRLEHLRRQVQDTAMRLGNLGMRGELGYEVDDYDYEEQEQEEQIEDLGSQSIRTVVPTTECSAAGEKSFFVDDDSFRLNLQRLPRTVRYHRSSFRRNQLNQESHQRNTNNSFDGDDEEESFSQNRVGLTQFQATSDDEIFIIGLNDA